jgi:hypothetical protein
MRTPRLALVLLVLFGVSAAGPLATLAHDARAALATPTLRITRLEPLIVKRVRFQPRERVRVAGFVNQTNVAITVRSNAAGTFTIDLGNDVHLEGCSAGAFLKAVGSRGTVAILKIPPRACAR